MIANRDLDEALLKISRLENPDSISSVQIQEKLDLLEALERGGVDNWQWYGETIEEYNETLKQEREASKTKGGKL